MQVRRGETRQPPSGATPNRQAPFGEHPNDRSARPGSAGRWLEPWGNPGPRGMAASPTGFARPGRQNPAYRPSPTFQPIFALSIGPASYFLASKSDRRNNRSQGRKQRSAGLGSPPSVDHAKPAKPERRSEQRQRRERRRGARRGAAHLWHALS